MNFDLMKLDILKLDITKLSLDKNVINALLVVFLAAVIVLDLFLFLPLMKAINEAQIEQKDYVQEISFARGLVAKKNKLTTAQLISPEKIDGFMDKIYDVAAKNKIEIFMNNDLAVEPSEDKEEKIYSKMTFSLNASGSFEGLGNFLEMLKKMPEAILDIQSMDMSTDPNKSLSIQAKITFALFVMKNNE